MPFAFTQFHESADVFIIRIIGQHLLQNRSETALHGIAENRSFGLFSSAADGGTTMSSATTPPL